MRAILFDLDGTLTTSKSPIAEGMSGYLAKLLGKFDVGIITGGSHGQIQSQVVARLRLEAKQKKRLHLLPTSGNEYRRYDQFSDTWNVIYCNTIPEAERLKIVEVVEREARRLDLWEVKPHGNIIEDRGSQITFSALGQEAPVALKEQWDVLGVRRAMLRDAIKEALPSYSVNVGGLTSVDVMAKGADKALGVRRFVIALSLRFHEVTFVGDQIYPGGNDYPATSTGVKTVSVKSPSDTLDWIRSVCP